MNFTSLIAKKFMFNSKHIGPSRLTGLIAVIGISLGTMAMVLSVSVLNGFESRIIEKIIGFEGDIKLSGEIEFNQSIQILSSIDEIDSFIPYTERVGLIINRENKSRMITFKSIETEMISTFYNIKFVEKTDSDLPMIYLGRTTADRLNLRLGDLVKLMSPLDQNIVWGVPRSVKVIIGGIFDVQILDFNDKMIFIPHEVGKKLFLRKKGFDGIDIRLINEGDPSKVKKIIQKKVTNSHLETWSEIHNNLFSAMRLERIGSLVVLSLIVLVGCFNLTTTLMLITIQKIRHFGILTAIGASKNNIHNIIFKQGFFTGLIGIFFGFLFSLGFIIGFPIGGILSEQFSISTPSILASSLSMINAIFAYFLLPESLNQKNRKMESIVLNPLSIIESSILNFKNYYQNQKFKSILIIFFLYSFAFSILHVTFVEFNREYLKMNSQKIGFIFMYIGIIGFLIQMFFIKSLIKIFNEENVMIIGFSLMAFGLVLTPFVDHMNWLFLTTFFVSSGNSLIAPTATSLISQKATKSEQGLILGITQSLGSLGRIFGPPFGGLTYYTIHMMFPFISAAIVLIGSIIFYQFMKCK